MKMGNMDLTILILVVGLYYALNKYRYGFLTAVLIIIFLRAYKVLFYKQCLIH